MSKKNISRYTQLDGTILLEYIINNDYEDYDNNDKDMFSLSMNETKVIIPKDNSLLNDGFIIVDKNNSLTNNSINHLCLLTNEKDKWYHFNDLNYLNDKVEMINFNSGDFIPYDTIRLHILSGYTFEDIFGILLNVYTLNDNNKKVNLANWLYKKSDREYIFEKPIFINNVMYDKYIDLKIPSVKYLRNYNGSNEFLLNFINTLNLNNDNLSNIYIKYSTISNDNVSKIYNEDLRVRKEVGISFYVDGELNNQIPYNSQADNFNLYMSESSEGDYIKFYTTWNDYPLNKDIVSMFNTRIKLYENVGNNNFNSIYDDFEEESNWIVIHDINVSFRNQNRKIGEEKYSITQDFTSNSQNIFYYKPIVNNINTTNIKFIDFDYTARLINRLDGIEIVRHGSLTTQNVERYLNNISRINTKNLTNYNVYNKIIKKEQRLINNNSLINNRYIKVFYNVNDIYIDKVNNENAIDVITLKNTSSTYKFVFKKKNEKNEDEYLDLSAINSSYVLVYKDNNEKENKINCTYSDNMRLTNGELEFNLSKTHLEKMKNSKYDYFNIVVNNFDGSQSTLFEGKYKFNN